MVELHLSGNGLLAEMPSAGIQSDTLKSLSLDDCGISSWVHIEKAIHGCLK